LGGMMASEHILANNLSAARKLLLQVRLGVPGLQCEAHLPGPPTALA
jgi:hypothetical protein